MDRLFFPCNITITHVCPEGFWAVKGENENSFSLCLESNTFGDSIWEMHSPFFIFFPQKGKCEWLDNGWEKCVHQQQEAEEKKREEKRKTFKAQTPGPSSSVWLILILIQCNDVGKMTNLVKLPASTLRSKSIRQFKDRHENVAYVSIFSEDNTLAQNYSEHFSLICHESLLISCCSGYSSHRLTSTQCSITNTCSIFSNSGTKGSMYAL